MQTRDEIIGANLQRVRQSLMTQQALAEAMKESGWKWSQATVWSIEKGERPLRMAEAVDLVALLDLNGVEELITTPLVTIGWQRMSAMEHARRRLEAATQDFMFHQYRLAITCDQIVEEGLELPIVSQDDEDIERLLESTPEEVVSAVTMRDSVKSLEEVSIPKQKKYLHLLLRKNPAAVRRPRIKSASHGEHQAEA